METFGAVPLAAMLLMQHSIIIILNLHSILFVYTILILNDYKDAERRSAEGDRKALCSPPQRRNPFAAYERDDLETD